MGWVPGIEPAGTKKQPEGPLGRLMLRKVCHPFPENHSQIDPKKRQQQKSIASWPGPAETLTWKD